MRTQGQFRDNPCQSWQDNGHSGAVWHLLLRPTHQPILNLISLFLYYVTKLSFLSQWFFQEVLLTYLPLIETQINQIHSPINILDLFSIKQ